MEGHSQEDGEAGLTDGGVGAEDSDLGGDLDSDLGGDLDTELDSGVDSGVDDEIGAELDDDPEPVGGSLTDPPEEEEEETGDGKLSTGIEILDNPEYLEGGFPKGSVVTLMADPIATAELFLYDLAETRKTHYFTTSRPKAAIEASLDQMDRAMETINIVDLYATDGPVNEAINALDEVGENENIIFDHMTDVARYDRFERVLNEVYEVTSNTDSIAYLYVITPTDAELTYSENKIPYASDVVMQMKTAVEGEKVENRLSITKLRGMTPPEKTIKLNIGEEVEIDTSRDIA